MKQKKTVAIVGTNGLPGRYGGWDQLMNNLTILEKDNYDFIVYTSSHNAVKDIKEVNGAKLKIIGLKANGWQSVPYDILSLFHAAVKYDVILVLGTSGCIVLPIIKLFRKKIILNPDGAEWKRGKWSKPIQWFLKQSEKIGVKFSTIVITDNRVISDYIFNDYNKESTLIEYGGDNAKYVDLSEITADFFQIEKNCYAFKVCRIEPENNISLILEAFSKLNYKLILIGNWNFSDYGIRLRNKYKIFKNLMLLDPIYDQERLDELRGNCGVYVHGHSVGGTNPSLVEAMNLGLLCVTYDVNYNRETTENSTLYFKTADELKLLISNIISKPENFYDIKVKLKEIADRRYKWSNIISKYSRTFE